MYLYSKLAGKVSLPKGTAPPLETIAFLIRNTDLDNQSAVRLAATCKSTWNAAQTKTSLLERKVTYDATPTRAIWGFFMRGQDEDLPGLIVKLTNLQNKYPTFKELRAINASDFYWVQSLIFECIWEEIRFPMNILVPLNKAMLQSRSTHSSALLNRLLQRNEVSRIAYLKQCTANLGYRDIVGLGLWGGSRLSQKGRLNPLPPENRRVVLSAQRVADLLKERLPHLSAFQRLLIWDGPLVKLVEFMLLAFLFIIVSV